VRLDAPPDTDPTTGFSLLTPDGRVAPTSVDCPADCVVTFPVAGPSLVYVRGDEQARWVLG